MTLRLACAYAAGLVVSLLFLTTMDRAGWRVVFGGTGVICGLGMLLFVGEKLARLFRSCMISSEDLANHARYLAAFTNYSAWLADSQRRERERQQRKREERRRQLSWWRSLNGQSFEEELARVLANRGYTVKRTGGPGDEGVDLIIQRSGERILVQCKAQNREIGPGPVRDLYGSLMHHRADEAWLVASHGFTYRARKFASNKPISLLTIEAILKHPEALL